ncbi:MAG: amidohydrolase family protein [Kofleriaceae bacterium]
MRWLLAALAIAACSNTPKQAAPASDPTITGHTPDGSSVRLELAGTTIARATPAESTAWLWPPIIDSHVHVAFWPIADQLPATGIAAVVDLAAPEHTLAARGDLHVLAAGPMLTREHGYPLESWGRDGYGLACGDAACVTAAIDRLVAAGARVIKLAADPDGLDPALVPVAIAAAHANHCKVAVHALTNAAALLAGRAGADVLAHTPVEPLADATIAAWRGKAVISTLAAFGGGPAAIENLRKLRAGGTTVLYGTDLGNLRDAGPSATELDLLAKAGLDDAAITAAMTTVPAAFWGFSIGTVAAGSEASFLLLDRDPRRDARVLLTPRNVWLRGRRVR